MFIKLLSKYLKIMMLLGMMFVWSVQPYSMIISMMMLTLGYSMFIYSWVGSYWYSYMLVLVMMSGVLVLFTYIASLIPNESFEYMSLVYIILFIYSMIFIGFGSISMFNFDMSLLMLKFWDLSLGLYNLFLVCILLTIMIMVVWLSGFDYGAVRNMY